MVSPSAVFTQLTAAGIRAVGSVGAVVYVAHHVRVGYVAAPVAAYRQRMVTSEIEAVRIVRDRILDE